MKSFDKLGATWKASVRFASMLVALFSSGCANPTTFDAETDSGTHAASAELAAPGEATVAWVLSYFEPNQDLASDSLHLAYSTDGLRWTALGPGRPAYQLSGIGTNHIRDPFVLRKSDGTFLYIATDWTLSINDASYWGHPSGKLVVADSADLITFTNPRLLEVTKLSGPNGAQMHAWAPEAFYDEARGAYAILWSGDTPDWRNRVYVSYTKDFTSLLNPTPQVYFDPGYSVIDASVLPGLVNGRRYMFFKDEREEQHDIQIARSTSGSLAPGSFVRWSASYPTRGTNQSVAQTTEGPFGLKLPGENRWVLYADYYLNGGVFGAWTTTNLDEDPSNWTRLDASAYTFPPGVRHANTVRVTQAELNALIAHYGVATRIRTTYGEGGSPYYVAHSWFHSMITWLADRNNGQLANDFTWRAVPGLANPNDPTLVSFEAVAQPGHYLHIDSGNPGRYPQCNEPSNRGYALCWVPTAERTHLTWIDPYVNSATYRRDATFRKVAARNGNTSMVSLQWYGDSSRYLRHQAYQLFARLLDGSAIQNTEASFTLER